MASGRPAAQATLRAASRTASGAAGPRFERADTAGAVERDRDPPPRGSQAEHCRVEPGTADRARADELVVLAVYPSATPERRRAEQTQKLSRRRRPGRWDDRRLEQSRPRLDAVTRALLGQEAHRDVAHQVALVEGAQPPALRDLADRGTLELPFPADRLDVLEPVRRADHPLLALGDHDLPRLHRLLAQGDAVEVNVDARFAFRGHLGECRGEAGRAAVLERGHEASLDELEARLDQLLPRERVTDLDARTLVVVLLRELLAGEHARAADPVAAGGGAVEDNVVARCRTSAPAVTRSAGRSPTHIALTRQLSA